MAVPSKTLDTAPFTPAQREALREATGPVGPLRLVIIHGEPLGAVLTATDDVVVGRDEGAGLPVRHGSISREHARLHHDGGGWFVEDRGSTNGTFVNGARVTTRCPLRQGDIVAFGAVVLKVYVADRRTGAARAAAGQIDALTGAFTAEYLDQRLEAEVGESYRRRQPLSVACVDVDDVEGLVRRHGQSAVDGALSEIADLLRDRLRRSDVLARAAPHTFVAVLSEVTLPIAVRIGRRLLEALRRHPLRTATEELHVRASVGVASTDGRWLSARELLEAGHAAAERARRRGGDRVRA